MSEYIFKLPDLGEGTVEAEIVEWHVKPGDEVKEGDVIVDVMTDKANVEVPAPVDGRVLRTSGEPGEVVAVGAELIALETAARAGRSPGKPSVPPPESGREPETRPVPAASEPAEPVSDSPQPEAPAPAEPAPVKLAAEKPAATAPTESASASAAGGGEAPEPTRVVTSPAIRRRAKEAGVDLAAVPGSGPRGRILRRDLERYLAEGPAAGAGPVQPVALRSHGGGPEYDEQKVVGVRRVIAERMSQSKREIPHFAYVEEVDVTELEGLRRHLNERHGRRLTVLPFIALGLIRTLAEFPQCNARYDSDAGVLRRYHSVHLGIATQTPDGLKVPVVRDAERLDLWRLADAIAEVAEAARSGKAPRGLLAGSTITITSLGPMGGVVTTPVVNHPEVGIIGVNKVVDRPVVYQGQIGIRTMMNLSSSFDHRFVDGFDAASMIQALKSLLEHPATLFIGSPPAGPA
jgi:2-oxoisovalerate dehydrogenase E2 component (dihydrolipoyl transacylase)